MLFITLADSNSFSLLSLRKESIFFLSKLFSEEYEVTLGSFLLTST